jgi:hypothetical protein
MKSLETIVANNLHLTETSLLPAMMEDDRGFAGKL